MPFIPRELGQYRAQDPAQQWLSQLRNGNRMTASLPLLDATGSFTERIAAPGSGGWRDIQAAGAQRRAIPTVRLRCRSVLQLEAPRPPSESPRRLR